jgi:hypothetical protein
MRASLTSEEAGFLFHFLASHTLFTKEAGSFLYLWMLFVVSTGVVYVFEQQKQNPIRAV